jgi:hypothetical protein
VDGGGRRSAPFSDPFGKEGIFLRFLTESLQGVE